MDTHIVVIDGDSLHCRTVTYALEEHGCAVTVLRGPRDAPDAIRHQAVDLRLLEISRSYLDSFAQGADDYVARPYEPVELLARVQAVLRRYSRHERHSYGVQVKVGGTSLDLGRLTFTTPTGNVVLLTPTEMRILECLMRNAHQVITREKLIEQTWGYDSESADNRVDVYIRRLRNKIEPDAQDRQLIRTIRGIGYVYEGDTAPGAVIDRSGWAPGASLDFSRVAGQVEGRAAVGNGPHAYANMSLLR